MAISQVLALFHAIAPQDPVKESLDDDQLTGNLRLSWFYNEHGMVYASCGTGYKFGGTNTDRINPVFDYVSDPETSESFEVGLKADGHINATPREPRTYGITFRKRFYKMPARTRYRAMCCRTAVCKLILLFSINTLSACSDANDRILSQAEAGSSSPLVIREQGSFYIGGEVLNRGAEDDVSIHQMYVQYQVPVDKERVPVVMTHGCCLSSKTWETTPDGRMGWREYFIREGHPVYLADQLDVIAEIPILIVFGDHLAETFDGRWQVSFNTCNGFIELINNAGGDAQMLYPPELGIYGNSHMLMQDRNSLQLADLILGWIAEHVD